MSTSFFKSSFSGGDGTCVEVAHRADCVLIRDSKFAGPSESEPILTVSPGLWPSFLDLALGGSGGRIGDQLSVNVFTDGSASLANPANVTLEYTAAEWDAFVKGVANGEFDR
ncbi:DUF397 domain-containing protein [Nocardia tengchongensis]|uniref:DUF397 domain-containing protein n=1 Tax=Nocardia tengchongensis TaxID=2055889 RepID=UPI0036765DD4